MASIKDLTEFVIQADIEKVKETTAALLAAGEDPLKIINEGLIPGINEVGERFKEGNLFVPEMMMSAQAMKAGVDLAKEKIEGADIPNAGTIVIGTVAGDLHDIGKNLVSMMLDSSGFNVVDLGVDVPADKFIAAVKEHKPSIVGLSALLTTTMPAMKEVIDALKESNLRDQVKVVIGGAPVSQAYADEIGADGYAPDAALAVELCKKIA
ncbi:MAG TPA: cobalamin-binding protein [Syntrophomonadaceae bacterium]|jgi:5-methyltetrahydrofolate--homocysteine methyltransferase|nr:cobalamin-binding protein [Syntrophomonadaceae bacterium]HHW29225.1 cobalamin-binding protein [Syntrophomonadaceae bacterium]